jgi:serine/threonine-protein kinase
MTIASSGTAALGIANDRSVAMTPDGTRVVYVGINNQLLVRPLDRLDATVIYTGAAPLNWVFVSPDNRWVGFAEGRMLRKVAITGGPAETIRQTNLTIGATWAPDDSIIFATSDLATGLQRVSANGGNVDVLTQPAPGELDHLWPEMLPGGRAVLFTISATTGGLAADQVAILDLATRKTRVLVRGGSHAHYVASGHLVYAAEGTLRAVPFDLARLEVGTMPVTVLPRLVTTQQGAGDFDVAADGTLAYVDAPGAASSAARTLVWVDRHGGEEPLGAPPRPYFHPRVSPDGARVAVAIEDQEYDIWVWDLTRRTLDRLTMDPAVEWAPVWTDPRHLAYFSGREGGGVFWQPVDGPGGAERLSAGSPPSGVTPDGGQLLFGSVGNQDIMMVALDGTRRVQPLLKNPPVERNGVVSPNGRWLAYEELDREGQQFEVYVRPFPGVNAGQWKISTAGGTQPLWARSGQELFYVAPDGGLMAVRTDPRGPKWELRTPAKVIEGPYMTRSLRDKPTYDVSTDGQRFLMVKQPANHAAPQIVVVQNWFEELNRLARRN